MPFLYDEEVASYGITQFLGFLFFVLIVVMLSFRLCLWMPFRNFSSVNFSQYKCNLHFQNAPYIFVQKTSSWTNKFGDLSATSLFILFFWQQYANTHIMIRPRKIDPKNKAWLCMSRVSNHWPKRKINIA